MLVTVFGATGLVGSYIVKQALLKKYKVRAFSRSVFATAFEENDNLELLQGSLFDDLAVYNAIQGSDAVLSAIGGLTDGVDKSRSLGIKHITEQMNKAGVKRIVAVGGEGILDSGYSGKLMMDMKGFPEEFIPVSKEHLDAYQTLKASGLDWTMVCPPAIVKGEATGLYKLAKDHVPDTGADAIHSGDVSLFMLTEMTDNDYVGHRVGMKGAS